MLGLSAAMMAAAPISQAATPSFPTEEDAPIALLADLQTGQILQAREPDRRFLPASVTKVMTIYLAFELLSRGQLKPNQMFTVSDQAFDDWGGVGSNMFLQRGEQVSADTLLHGITTVSANDGCIVLAQGAAGSVDRWVVMMNRTAHQLGMENSHFGSPNGWPDEGKTFTTARDLAKLAHAMVTRHPDLYREYIGKHGFTHNGITQTNHDPITGVVPGADGIKTGYTRQAGYNFLGSAVRDGRRLGIVVAGIDTPPVRTRVTREMIEWGFQYFQPRQIFPAGATFGTAQVQDGSARSVGLWTPRPIVVDLPEGAHPRISVTLRYKGPLRAPIKAGEEVAELEVRGAGIEPYTVPLQASADVSQANPLQRILNAVLSLLG